MNIRKIISGLLILTSATLALPARAQPLISTAVAWQPGFVIRAEDRFDPAIQRLMAEYSLRSLPLERGQLYYLYPMGFTPRQEGMQIRYLETLLDKKADRDASASSAGAEAKAEAEAEVEAGKE